jgi:hypothetical protein
MTGTQGVAEMKNIVDLISLVNAALNLGVILADLIRSAHKRSQLPSPKDESQAADENQCGPEEVTKES